MYVSRLNFHTAPGKTHQLEQQLATLVKMVETAEGLRPRIMRTHYASLGAPDVVFEQEATDLTILEEQITKVAKTDEFQRWSQGVSGLLAQSPKREVYLVVE